MSAYPARKQADRGYAERSTTFESPCFGQIKNPISHRNTSRCELGLMRTKSIEGNPPFISVTADSSCSGSFLILWLSSFIAIVLSLYFPSLFPY
ncbi:hypothetical protein SAY87_007501 [Trapa incisa]|uniref:Uncharacterized protein n=1 Tax=Trapa incisa TaxID=236973 RepID=A0AAN7QFC6_9MYRT|nr:hypothetical protein SAY87_007501 [Trapa incisa]